MNHTALNMHYVNGIPANKPMPPILNLLSDNNQYDYPELFVCSKPDS